MAAVLPHTARQFARAIVMPNLKPPVTTTAEAAAYRARIQAALPAAELAMNDIGEISLRTAKPLFYDGYAANRLTGSFILIEPGTNATVAAGMLAAPQNALTLEYNDFAI